MSVTLDVVRKIFSSYYSRLITKEHYKKPQFDPSRWALLDGPFYGKEDFNGSLLIDLSKMRDWSIANAQHSWTNQTPEQEAKDYFSVWLKNVEIDTQAITILDKEQRAFLQNHRTDFVDNNWHQIYCPQCRAIYKTFNRQRINEEQDGKKLSWTLEWKCILGHLLFREHDSIRLF